MIPQRGSPLRKPTAPPRRAHTEPAPSGYARHARPALSGFWNAWSACLLPILAEPHGSREARFVAESEKVTFDVKYFGLRGPVDELCDGARTALAGSRYGRPGSRPHGRQGNASRQPKQEASLGRRP